MRGREKDRQTNSKQKEECEGERERKGGRKKGGEGEREEKMCLSAEKLVSKG